MLLLDKDLFLRDVWQKKPLVMRQVWPDFVNPLTSDELAGLALEDDIESRLVFETPQVSPFWTLKRGPFGEHDFQSLPKTHWTLLVQGVDRWVPEVMCMLNAFDFIPQWRVDDVMVSYAVTHGSVGPHYDHYDVFLYQARGRRQWTLTTKNCHESNYLNDVDLRIMKNFEVEETHILEPGDMLYLPPHVGHHGVSLDDECMTYSFGYRRYQGQEMWANFADYLSEKQIKTPLYCDPSWLNLTGTSAIPKQAYLNAKALMQSLLDDETQLKHWFACFATRLDEQAWYDLPEPLSENECNRDVFMSSLKQETHLMRDACCRMAYYEEDMSLFINGNDWDSRGVSPDLIKYVANHRVLVVAELVPFLMQEDNQAFLYDLWRLQWIGFSK